VPFDLRFLVYGPQQEVQALPRELRHLLLERAFEGLRVACQEISRPLSHACAQAEEQLAEVLALGDSLENLVGPDEC
jgi:hypothetical protein